MTSRKVHLHNRDARPGEEIDLWRERFKSVLYPNTVHALQDEVFTADFVGVETARSSVLHGQISPARTVVTKSDVACIEPGRFQLILADVDGGTHITRRGTVQLPRGSLLVEMLDEQRTSFRPMRSIVGTILPDITRMPLPAESIRRLAFTPLQLSDAARVTYVGAIRSMIGMAPADADMIDRYLAVTAELVLNEYLDIRPSSESTDIATKNLIKSIIRRQYIDVQLSADKLAEMAGISRRKLYKLFEGGQSPMDLVRIERAKSANKMLANLKNGLTMTEIAEKSGFTNAQTLRRTLSWYNSGPLNQEPGE